MKPSDLPEGASITVTKNKDGTWSGRCAAFNGAEVTAVDVRGRKNPVSLIFALATKWQRGQMWGSRLIKNGGDDAEAKESNQ